MVNVTEVGVPNAVVESANTPTIVSAGEEVPWDFIIHNIGGIGIFGGAIENQPESPGSIFVTWNGQVTEVAPGMAFIVNYIEPQPNCIRLETSGTIRYPTEGTYVIHIAGVHQEDTTWYKDDYKAFTVVASGVAPGNVNLSGIVTGFLGMPVGGAVVMLNGTEKITDSSGRYDFLSIATGTYTISVAHSLYNTHTEALSLLTAGDHTKNIALGVKMMILVGLPIAAGVGIGGVYTLAKKPKVK